MMKILKGKKNREGEGRRDEEELMREESERLGKEG